MIQFKVWETEDQWNVQTKYLESLQLLKQKNTTNEGKTNTF